MPIIMRKRDFRFRRLAMLTFCTSLIGTWANLACAALPIEKQATQWIDQQIQQVGRQQGWQSVSSSASVQLFNANHRASPCSTPLVFTAPLLPQSPTRFPLVISCQSTNGSWKIRAQANVEIHLAAVVAVSALPAGTTLTAADVQIMPVVLKPGARVSVITKIEAAQQMTLKRAVTAGQPLTALLLSSPTLIHRNQAVTLVIQQEGLELTTGGVALQNGSKGETIRVKNSGSGRIISGTVRDAQQVLIRIIE